MPYDIPFFIAPILFLNKNLLFYPYPIADGGSFLSKVIPLLTFERYIYEHFQVAFPPMIKQSLPPFYKT